MLGPALLVSYGAVLTVIGGVYIGCDAVRRGSRAGTELEAMVLMAVGGAVLVVGTLPLLGLYLAAHDVPGVYSPGGDAPAVLAGDTLRLIDATLILGSLMLWSGVAALAALAASLRGDAAWPAHRCGSQALLRLTTGVWLRAWPGRRPSHWPGSRPPWHRERAADRRSHRGGSRRGRQRRRPPVPVTPGAPRTRRLCIFKVDGLRGLPSA